jgi:hypothetical protein
MLCSTNALHEISELDSDGCIFRGAIGANLAVFGTLLSHLAAVIGGTHKSEQLRWRHMLFGVRSVDRTKEYDA